jgi:yecA family protein
MTKPAWSYDELDAILRGGGRSGAIGMSAIDGLIAALVAGPAFVSPQEWLPLIFAGRLPAAVDGTPEHRAVNTILSRYNEVSSTLADAPDAYRPIFMTDAGQLIVRDWAEGFVLGIAQRAEAWSAILLSEKRKLLAPILAPAQVGRKMLPELSRAEQKRIHGTAHLHIAGAVVAVRAICNPLRATTLEPTTPRQPRARKR